MTAPGTVPIVDQDDFNESNHTNLLQEQIGDLTSVIEEFGDFCQEFDDDGQIVVDTRERPKVDSLVNLFMSLRRKILEPNSSIGISTITNNGGYILITTNISFDITEVNQGNKTFTVRGDKTEYFPPTSSLIDLTVAGSTGNDGSYTATNSQYTGGNTIITVLQSIPSAIADGIISNSVVHGVNIDDKVIITNSDIGTYDGFHRVTDISGNADEFTVGTVYSSGDTGGVFSEHNGIKGRILQSSGIKNFPLIPPGLVFIIAGEEDTGEGVVGGISSCPPGYIELDNTTAISNGNSPFDDLDVDRYTHDMGGICFRGQGNGVNNPYDDFSGMSQSEVENNSWKTFFDNSSISIGQVHGIDVHDHGMDSHSSGGYEPSYLGHTHSMSHRHKHEHHLPIHKHTGPSHSHAQAFHQHLVPSDSSEESHSHLAAGLTVALSDAWDGYDGRIVPDTSSSGMKHRHGIDYVNYGNFTYPSNTYTSNNYVSLESVAEYNSTNTEDDFIEDISGSSADSNSLATSSSVSDTLGSVVNGHVPRFKSVKFCMKE